MTDQRFLSQDLNTTVSIPQEDNEEFGPYSAMKAGFKDVRRGPNSSHPLEKSLQNHEERMFGMRMDMLHRMQGVYAPVQLQMELKTTRKGAHRLPCLPSSNIATEILMGTDTRISPKDVFNDRDHPEVMGDPHIMAEHSAGLRIL